MLPVMTGHCTVAWQRVQSYYPEEQSVEVDYSIYHSPLVLLSHLSFRAHAGSWIVTW